MIPCTHADRCHLCKIYSSSINNYQSELKTQGPNLGRPLQQSPVSLICSKCGMSNDVDDIDFCKRVMKRQTNFSAGRKTLRRKGRISWIH